MANTQNVNIRPLRDYNPHEVINLFTVSGTIPFLKGTFVKIISGAYGDQQNPYSLGAVGYPWTNTVSDRYGVQPMVGSAGSGDICVGMTLYDVREYDENGEKLIFHKDKAERMQVVPSGCSVPILRRGFIQYSGINNGHPLIQTTGGSPLYVSAAGDGQLTTSGVGIKVGTCYGPTDSNGYTFVFIDC